MSPPAMPWRAAVVAELEWTRRRTLALVEPLPEPVLRRQVRDFMSPLLWDLAHVAGFEELWLIEVMEGAAGARLQEAYDALETPRAARGALQMPSKEAVLERLARVRARALERLDGRSGSDSPGAAPATGPLLQDGYVYRMVVQHEGQHQETMLQALDLLAEDWGCDPAAAAGGAAPAVNDEARVAIGAGPFRMGTADRGRAYDNERPAHDVELASFAIDRYPATNRRWLAFMEDGGYRRPELWSAGGRRWLEASGATSPQGWEVGGKGLRVNRFGRSRPVQPAEPVQHVCFWEAEAFARWCGGRLPSEAEWEKAATGGSAADHPFEGGAGPPRVGGSPGLASAHGIEDLFGSVYQWTRSAFEPYPGFTPFPYREYSEVHFGGAYRVLRGAAWTAHPALWRASYRNWDLPHRRQIFAGVRVAYGPE